MSKYPYNENKGKYFHIMKVDNIDTILWGDNIKQLEKKILKINKAQGDGDAK